MIENSGETGSLNISRLTKCLFVRCQYFLVALMNMNLNTVLKKYMINMMIIITIPIIIIVMVMIITKLIN